MVYPWVIAAPVTELLQQRAVGGDGSDQEAGQLVAVENMALAVEVIIGQDLTPGRRGGSGSGTPKGIVGRTGVRLRFDRGLARRVRGG